MITSRIEIYKNLKEDWQFTVGNKNVEGFDTSKLNPASDKKIEEFCGIEYVIRAENDQDDLELFYLESVYNFIESFEDDFYLFFSEYDAQPRNRIRSFKGLLKKEASIDSSEILEIEVDLDHDLSLFAAMVKITKNNFEHCISNCFENSDIGFITNSSRWYSEDFVTDLVKSNADQHGIFTMDYLDLLINKNTDIGYVLRNGGYDEPNCSSFQIFTKKENEAEITSKLVSLNPASTP